MPDMRLAHLHPLRWLGRRDRGFAALRRATRTAIIMPAMFALGDGHRQPAVGYVRGVRVFRDAAPGRLRRPHGGTAPGAGSARRHWRSVRLPCHAGLADRVARGRCDGGGGVRRDLCWRGQLGAGRGDHGAAAGVILPVSLAVPASAVPDRLAGWGWPEASRWLRRGSCGPRQRATGCVCRGRRLPGAGRPAGRGSRTCSAAWTDNLRGIAITRLRRRTRQSRRCAVPSWPRPTAQPGEHSRSDDRAPGRRADLAEQHRHSAWAAPQRRHPGSAEGHGGRGRGSRPAADLLDSRGGSSDELGAALTELAAAHAKMQEGVTADLPARSLGRRVTRPGGPAGRA